MVKNRVVKWEMIGIVFQTKKGDVMMKICPVCGRERTRGICDVCGFDDSMNYEEYMTFGMIQTDNISSISTREQQWNIQGIPHNSMNMSGNQSDFENHSAREAGIVQNDAEAIMWYRQAGGPHCTEKKKVQYRDGYIWREKEIEVEIEQKTTLNPVRPAAQYNLGYCYEYGCGVKKNITMAIDWYLKSAKQANRLAYRKLQYYIVHGGGSEANNQAVFQWSQSQAESGDAWGQCILGDCYFYGRGTAQSDRSAVEWYQLAAEAQEGTIQAAQQCMPGSGEAQYRLGCCYAHGRGVEMNLEKAKLYYDCAAKQGVFEI